MTGDTNYNLIFTGLTSLSAATAHSLLGNYNGLSNLHVNDAVHIQVLASVNNVVLWPSSAASTQVGFRMVAGNDYYLDLPAMKISRATELHVGNETGASNGAVRFAVWRRM